MTSNIKFLYILSNILISMYDSRNINIYQSEIKKIKILKKDLGTFINNKVKINLNRDIIIINNNKINKWILCEKNSKIEDIVPIMIIQMMK